MSKNKPITPHQAELLRKVAMDKGVDREAFNSSLHNGRFAMLLDNLAFFSKTPNIVHVDRSVDPYYPTWVRESDVLHPELEREGPTEFQLQNLSIWLHEKQKKGESVEGTTIYEHLRDSGELPLQLNFQDGMAICDQVSAEDYRMMFPYNDHVLTLWASPIRRRRFDDILVPYVLDDGEEMGVHWIELANVFGGFAVQFRHARQS